MVGITNMELKIIYNVHYRSCGYPVLSISCYNIFCGCNV